MIRKQIIETEVSQLLIGASLNHSAAVGRLNRGLRKLATLSIKLQELNVDQLEG